MGEVFRARDTRLGREVAIKILPRVFTSDRERLARFEREARVLAALNHPNIGAIYGLEDNDGTPALVLELIDGETLADRIVRGPIPPKDALPLARQITEALAAAHAKGIVHRDLKPRNIALTRDGTVKVLDFGLAKASIDSGAATDRPDALTMSIGGTRQGMVLGTAAYMSPEQARGHAIDQRTDIWAFGCVLYEMLTARVAFPGDTLPDTIAAVLEREPNWAALPPLTPKPVRRLLERCLTKDRAARLGDINEARSVLESRSPQAHVPGRAVTFAIVATIVVGIAIAWLTLGGAPAARPVPVQITHFATAVRDPALSPDGRMLAYVVQEPQGVDSQIYVQPVNGGRPQPLTRTRGRKAWPAFSPDGSQIAFTLTGEEWKWDTWVVPIVGGEAPRLLLPNAHQLQWIDDGRVLFAEFKKGDQVGIVDARVGRSDARDVYVPPAGMAHVSDLSRDRRLVAIGQMSPLSCFVLPFEGPGEPQPIGTPEIPCSMFVRWSRDGRWLYFASGRPPDFQLFRQPAGGGRPEQLTFDRGLAGIGVVTWFALTGDGRSVIYPSGDAQETVWLQRSGENDTQLTFEGDARNPSISADGRRLVYLSGPRFSPAQMWMRSLDGSSPVQVAPEFRAVSIAPSPDGRFIAFAGPDAHKKTHLWLASIDSAWTPREIDVGDHEVGDVLVGPDNKTLFYLAREGTNTQIWRVDADGKNRRPITEREPSLRLSSISPDGRRISVTRGARTPREEWVYRSSRRTSSLSPSQGPILRASCTRRSKTVPTCFS